MNCRFGAVLRKRLPRDGKQIGPTGVASAVPGLTETEQVRFDMVEGFIPKRRKRLKRAPQIIKKVLADGTNRYYCYAERGGVLLFTRDGAPPSQEEVASAVASLPKPKEAKPEPTERGRGKGPHRPLFIKELIRLAPSDARWTYFIGEAGGAIKIGAAKCVRTRLKTLQAHNPKQLEVLAMVRGGEVLESAYHSLFAAHRINNEWFVPAPAIMAEIRCLQTT